MAGAADPHLEPFVRYIWSAQEAPTPAYQTMAHAAVRGDWRGFRPEWHTQRLPLGRVWVYPDFVAFLSASRVKAGQIPRGGQHVLRVLEDYREMLALTQNPVSIANEIRRSGGDVRERLRRMLANQNSFVIPADSVKHIEERKVASFRGIVQWWEVSTADREIVLAPPSTVGKEILGSVASTFGARWEPGLLGHLRNMQRTGRTA